MAVALDSEKSLIDIVAPKNVEEEEILLKEEKDSLYENHSMNYTICMVVGMILNVALLLFSHFGISAVMLSTICPEGFAGCPSGTPSTVGEFFDACSNSTQDAAILVPGNPAYDDFAEYSNTFGRTCFFAPPNHPDDLGCVQFLVIQNFNLTLNCSSCFEEQYQCAQDHCAAKCAKIVLDQECIDCAFEFCTDRFTECTGIFIQSPSPTESPTTSRRVLAEEDFKDNGKCLDKDNPDIEFFDVFDLTFFNSVNKAWTGGSRGLAVLVVLASGIWPYLKNILMASCWFFTMKNKTRENILRALAVLGKWSFVDVYAVVLILNGVRIDKVLNQDPFSPLIVFAESRLAIYAFGIAAIWALIQGEYIRHLARSHKLNKLTKTTATYMKTPEILSLTTELTNKDLNVIKACKALLFVFSLGALGLGIAGCVMTDLDFTMSGLINNFEGPDYYKYNTFEVSFGAVDDCSIYKRHGSIAGAYFLSILFFCMCALIPFITYVLFAILAIRFSPSYSKGLKRDAGLSFVLGISNFAAMDVFFLSLLTLITQFEGLINSAVGDSVDAQCGIDGSNPEEFCIKFKGRLKFGAYLILASVGCFWVSQALVTIMVSRLEKTRIIY